MRMVGPRVFPHGREINGLVRGATSIGTLQAQREFSTHVAPTAFSDCDFICCCATGVCCGCCGRGRP
jgi:hypothetical protein